VRLQSDIFFRFFESLDTCTFRSSLDPVGLALEWIGRQRNTMAVLIRVEVLPIDGKAAQPELAEAKVKMFLSQMRLGGMRQR
jgi:hypothetical protein